MRAAQELSQRKETTEKFTKWKQKTFVLPFWVVFFKTLIIVLYFEESPQSVKAQVFKFPSKPLSCSQLHGASVALSTCFYLQMSQSLLHSQPSLCLPPLTAWRLIFFHLIQRSKGHLLHLPFTPSVSPLPSVFLTRPMLLVDKTTIIVYIYQLWASVAHIKYLFTEIPTANPPALEKLQGMMRGIVL